MAVSSVPGGPTESDRRVREQEVANQKRMVELTHQIRDAEVEASKKIDDIKDTYERRSIEETHRREEAMQKQQVEGYQRLLEQKRQQDADLARSRMMGEKAQTDVQSFFDAEIDRVSRDGEVKLRNIQADSSLLNDTLKRDGENRAKMEALKQQEERLTRDAVHRQRINEQAKLQKEETERTQQFYEQATESAVTQARDRHGKIISQNEKELFSLFRNSKTQLDQIRNDNARKLSAYGSRQSDPFYQPVKLNADLTESDDQYVIKAKVPEHEQKFVSVSVKGGNELVVSGQRRSKDVIEKPEGGLQTTASFQSFTETFKLGIPVQKENIEKEFKGDQLVITVPKVGIDRRPMEKRQVAAPQPRLEKPRFPDNLSVDSSPTPQASVKDPV